MKRALHTFFQAISKLNLINEIIAELSSVVLAIVVIWGILLTYVFKKSDIFSVEISEYLLILTVFASIAFIQKEDRHVKVDMLIEKLSPIKRKKLEIINSFLCSLFCAIATWEAATIMVMNYQRNFFSTSLIKFPIWIPYFIIFYGFLMLTLQFLVRIYSLINELINNSNR
ncbi:MAG: TRAP transporter small permease [Candidatus Atribacteria bacterium]|nr:TRAP transporter small permease [Candidatus Atribacteria bacterium]